MPGDATIGSSVVGTCIHGYWSGIIVSGSAVVLTEGPGQAVIGSAIVTTCPYCPTGVCVSGSAVVLTEGPGNHRIGDSVTVPTGGGVTVSGSGTCISG